MPQEEFEPAIPADPLLRPLGHWDLFRLYLYVFLRRQKINYYTDVMDTKSFRTDGLNYS
jgi:hypothetical protein